MDYAGVSFWLETCGDDLTPRPPLGHWHTRGFTAAIAPATRILATRDRQAEIIAFLRAASDGAVAALR